MAIGPLKRLVIRTAATNAHRDAKGRRIQPPPWPTAGHRPLVQWEYTIDLLSPRQGSDAAAWRQSASELRGHVRRAFVRQSWSLTSRGSALHDWNFIPQSILSSTEPIPLQRGLKKNFWGYNTPSISLRRPSLTGTVKRCARRPRRFANDPAIRRSILDVVCQPTA